MALVSFKKGVLANLPTSRVEGTFYVTTDERAIYLDLNGTDRIRLGEFQEFANIDALKENTNPSTTALYYITDVNCLAKYDGSKYIQINPDTGAIKVDVTGGEDNGVTASYDAATRTITLTMSKTFLEAADISSLTTDVAGLKEKVGEKDVATQISEAIEALKLDETYDKKGDADGALEDAKTYIDGKDSAMNTRVEALEDNDAEQDDRLDDLESKITGLSGAMHFKGTVSEDPASMKQFDDYEKGDVVVYRQKEFVFDGTAFVELGDVTTEAQRISALEAKMTGITDTVAKYTGDLVDTAKSELVGTAEGVTATTIKEGVAEAEADAATKDEALKEELIGEGESSSEDTIKGAKKYAQEQLETALTWGSF